MERAVNAPRRGYYFDLNRFHANWEKHQSPTTPAVSGLFALQAQLDRMRAEGMERRWARHAEMAERTHAWVDEMREAGAPLRLLAPEGYRSPAVTAVRTEGMTGPEVTAAARERGWVIGGGYGKLREGTFRIGHMGEKTTDELDGLLEVLTEVLS